MILGVTGHRPNELPCGYDKEHPWMDHIEDILYTKLEQLNPEKVLTGMALGFDQWVAEVCIDIGVPFEAILPFPDIHARWNRESKDNYEKLLSHAKAVTTIYPKYTGDGYFKRDKLIVEKSDTIIALYDGRKKGGTYYTLAYAKKVGKEDKIINIYTK